MNFQTRGTVQQSNNKINQTNLSVVEYDGISFIEKEDVSVEECIEHLTTPSMTWIQVYGMQNPKVITDISNHFKVHPLAIEDILSTYQRPKVDIYQNQLFITLRWLSINKKEELENEQISLVLGENYLISFSEKKEAFFNTIKEKLRQSNHHAGKKGTDYIVYSILDAVVDNYFLVLEVVDERLDKLEDDLLRQPKTVTILRIQKAKRDMITLRKSIWPLRDVVSQLQRTEPTLISATTQIYLRDVYDHIIRIIDVIEGLRDIVSGMLDIYLSNINIRTNDIMKVLTIVSTIFVPLTFISSLYGMNFEYMPELHSRWGYPLALSFMLMMAGGMLVYFRKKKWI